MTNSRGIPGSFRDPSGFVFQNDEGVLYRQINAVYEPEYRRLMESGLYQELVDHTLLIPHEEVPLSYRRTDAACAVIRPEVVPFVSYPYEWCFSGLQDAALLTLEVQKRALRRGMSLKDSSAYNVQFSGTNPVFIDTLSFETYEEGRPWVGYRQFCRHFLGPLALMSVVDPRMNGLLRAHIDGVPLDMASRMLPARSRLRLGTLLHLHLHAGAETRHARRSEGHPETGHERTISRRGLDGILDSLESTVRRLSAPRSTSIWTEYYATNSYSDEAAAEKRGIVAAYLERIKPAVAWDLGANTGVFSEVAKASGAHTVAIEQDPLCVEACYRAWKERRRVILPLCIDLTNPSPALGWAHAERQSLRDRGPADVVLALAFVHHLCIGNNVPLPDLADFLRSIGRHVIIEFVPKEDAMVRRMLESRKDIFPEYTRAGFEEAFTRFFRILDSGSEASARPLYLMEAR